LKIGNLFPFQEFFLIIVLRNYFLLLLSPVIEAIGVLRGVTLLLCLLFPPFIPLGLQCPSRQGLSYLLILYSMSVT
jgi:hypothetical protein